MHVKLVSVGEENTRCHLTLSIGHLNFGCDYLWWVGNQQLQVNMNIFTWNYTESVLITCLGISKQD